MSKYEWVVRDGFDLSKLKKEFKKHCPAYMEDLSDDMPSAAIGFCSTFMYKIQPDSKSLKKGDKKIWKILCKANVPVESPEASPTEETHTINIVTHKLEDDIEEKNTMTIFLQEAGLLAMDTFSKLARKTFNDEGKVIFTRLAEAIFYEGEVKKMAEELKMPEVELIVAINDSTYVGGHYLPHSNVNIALCAAMYTTKYKDESIRIRVLNKIRSKYLKEKNQRPDEEAIKIITKFCNGGLPEEFSYENLKAGFDEGQKIRRTQKLDGLSIDDKLQWIKNQMKM